MAIIEEYVPYNKIVRPNKGFQESFVSSNVDFVIGGGSLNCQPLGSIVMTPFGERKIEDLKVGDTISGSDGNHQAVLRKIQHEAQLIVEITFEDDRKVRCSTEHLWCVCEKSGEYKTITTSNIIEGLDSGNSLYIPLYNPTSQSTESFYRKLEHYFKNDDDRISVELSKSEALYIQKEAWSFGLICSKSDLVDTCVLHITKSDRLKIKSYEYQGYEPVISITVSNRDSLYVTDNFVVTHNCGKAQPLYSRVLTPSGYTTMGELQVGSTILDTDGNAQHVLKIHEQGLKDIHRITFNKGQVVECCIEHLWNVIDKEYNDELVLTLDDIMYLGVDKFIFPRYENGSVIYDLYINKVEKFGYTEMRCISVSNPNKLYITDDFIVTHNTFAALLMVAEPLLDPNFSAVFLRNNMGDLKAGGGIIDEAKKLYGSICDITESGDPKMVCRKSGARVEFTHLSDQTKATIEQRFKGRQYGLVYFDEGTGFTWDCFKTVATRNRGSSEWTNKIRMTTNPKKSHWLRVFLDWYIGADGLIIPERDGVVRYFFANGDRVEDVVFGSSKKEVYFKCKSSIDKLNRGRNSTYEDFIMSTVFYQGIMEENVQSMANNKGYLAAVAMGGNDAIVNLGGNWNVDPEDETDQEISHEQARSVFDNDPCVNGDKWITADLATVGTDNFVAIVWDGFHIIDVLVRGKTGAKENADLLLELARKYDIGHHNIVYDGTNGQYIADYIPQAISFISARSAHGREKWTHQTVKDESYARLCAVINDGRFSIDKEVAKRPYKHANIRDSFSIYNEFIDECMVIRFKKMNSGKRKLWSKENMNAKLGRGRSMDLLDPCAMRMYPMLEYEFGKELDMTAVYKEEQEEFNYFGDRFAGDPDWS